MIYGRCLVHLHNTFELVTKGEVSIDFFNFYRELRSKVSFRKTHVELLVVVVDIRQVIRTFIYIDIG